MARSMTLRSSLVLQCIFLAACQGPVRLTDHWEAGEISADATHVFGATLDGIRRVGRDGSRAIVLVAYSSGVFEESQHRPGRIALDERHVYWTQRDARPGVDAVRRVSKAGGSAQSVLKVRSAAESGPLYLQVGESSVYLLTYGRGPFGSWVTDTAAGYDGGSLIRANKRTGSATELAAHVRAGSGLALDQEYVYWSEAGTFRSTESGIADHVYNRDGRILRVRKSGGAVETVASGLDNPRELSAGNGRIQFRAGMHYEKNRSTPDLGFFEVEARGGVPRRIGDRPYRLPDGTRYSVRKQDFGPGGTYGRRAHYFVEREDARGAIRRVYATDEDISSFIVDRGELFWLQGTAYSLMKLVPH